MARTEGSPVRGELSEEVATLGRRIRAEVGPADVRSLKALWWLSKGAELFGRVGLGVASGPVTFAGSVALLTLHLGLEAQLNHTIQHGAYRRLPGAERFAPGEYETLALPMQTRTWRDAHRIHHANPSLFGRDPDTVHPLFRVHPAQPWRPWHLFNVFLGVLFVFECWGYDYDRFLKRAGRRPASDRSEAWKLVRFGAHQYVLFPILAGPNAGTMLAGTLIALFLRSLIYVALQTGSSVGARVSLTHAELPRVPRGDPWVRFQVETSKNYEAPAWFTLLSGGLDRHIEHHLFPTLPPMRLRQVAAEVRALARRRGVSYEEHAGLGASLRDSLGHLWSLSFPTRSETPPPDRGGSPGPPA